MELTKVQVNKQRNLDKYIYKEKKRDSIVVILFINHKPVSQPIIWEEWKKINNVEYEVVCPFTITVNCSFSRKYQLEDDFYMNENTQWGSFSYSFYLIESIKKILEMYKDIDNGMIYIVSGDDIPLYNLHPINFNYNEFDIKHSELISNFSGFCFKKLREIDFNTKTFIDFLKYYYGQKNNSGFQPPEFYWYNYFHGEPEEEDKCDRLNLQFHRFECIQSKHSYSPIEWYLFKDQFEYVKDIQYFDKELERKTVSAITNLRKLLLFMRKETNNSRTLFFRKVMSSCETSQLLTLLQDCFWRTFNCESVDLSKEVKIPWPFVDGNEIFLFQYRGFDVKDIKYIINILKNHDILKENSNYICLEILVPFLRSTENKTSYKPDDHALDIYFYLKSIAQNHYKIEDILKKLKTIQTMINKDEIKEDDIKQTHGIQTLLIETTTKKHNTTNKKQEEKNQNNEVTIPTMRLSIERIDR